MDPSPYSQTAQDPTQQQGLLQILQQIQAIQNRPLIPENPLSQLGAALQGASAGFAGQPNPAMAQAMAQRQQQLSGLSQTAGLMGQIATIKQQEATLAETRRARAVQEKAEERAGKTEERLRQEASLKFADDAWKKALELGDPNMGAVAYETLSKEKPGFWPPMPAEKIKALLTDKIGREDFRKNQVGMAAAAYLGEATYLGRPIPDDVRNMPKRALALMAGKTETQLLHGSLEEWEISLRKKVALAGGFDNLSPEERAEYFALVGRNATDAKDAAISDMQADIAKYGKTQKPIGGYFRTARQRQDLSPSLRQQLKLDGLDPDTASTQQMNEAEGRYRSKVIADSTAKDLRQSAQQEYNFRLGHKDKKQDQRFRYMPTEEVRKLAMGDPNALLQLLDALRVTVKPGAETPAAAASGEPVLKNGKTMEQTIQDGMSGGASRAEVETEVLRLRKAGKL